MLLENVAVLPSHHGHGVGRALLAAEDRQPRLTASALTHDDGREPALYERSATSRPRDETGRRSTRRS